MRSLEMFISKKDIKNYKKHLKEKDAEYKEEMSTTCSLFYNIEPKVDVRYPIWPVMDSKIVLALPEKGTQKYVLLHRIGENMSSFNIVSFPEEYHRGIGSRYNDWRFTDIPKYIRLRADMVENPDKYGEEEEVQKILRQIDNLINQTVWDLDAAWLFVPVGGFMETDGKGNLHISGDSGDFGSNILGYDSNAIVAHILEDSKIFKSVTYEVGAELKTDAQELFDLLLEEYLKCDNDMYLFLEKIMGIYKETKPAGRVINAQLYMYAAIEMIKKQTSNHIQTVVDSLGTFGREKFIGGFAEKIRGEKT